MSNFKDNPAKPFEVRVLNKIRKRITMHERAEVSRQREIKSGLEKILPAPSPSVPTIRKRGSMWRFISKVKQFLGEKK